MHSMEFATYEDCVEAQKQTNTMFTNEKDKSQCLPKGSVISDSFDKTKGAFGAWLKEQSEKYNNQN